MVTDRFITFEGGEGSGKSTQVRLLAQSLLAAGHDVVITREPGGSPLAERIRDLILAEKPHAPVAEFLLFAAARAEHIAVTIKPALARGAIVICDRFIDSTRAYQGYLGHVDMAFIQAVEGSTVAPFYPALTLVLDVPVAAAMARTTARGDLSRYDRHSAEWHGALRTAFCTIASAEPERCVLIDGSRDETSVAADIRHAVGQRMSLGVV
jgi:dTMP kinase